MKEGKRYIFSSNFPFYVDFFPPIFICIAFQISEFLYPLSHLHLFLLVDVCSAIFFHLLHCRFSRIQQHQLLSSFFHASLSTPAFLSALLSFGHTPQAGLLAFLLMAVTSCLIQGESPQLIGRLSTRPS